MDNLLANSSLGIEQYNFRLYDLDVTTDKLIKIIGYTKSNVPEQILNGVNDILKLFLNHIIIKCGYKRFDSKSVKIDSSGFMIKDIFFNCGKIIGKHFKNCESLIFLLITLGDVYEKLFESFKIKNDYLQLYLVDKIASEFVESAADKLENLIEQNLVSEGINITNRCSPGYCGWNVSEQKKLFSLLPYNFCGVTLNESSMMNPIKSISAVIGIGKNAKRQDYDCYNCDDEFCYKKKNYE